MGASASVPATSTVLGPQSRATIYSSPDRRSTRKRRRVADIEQPTRSTRLGLRPALAISTHPSDLAPQCTEISPQLNIAGLIREFQFAHGRKILEEEVALLVKLFERREDKRTGGWYTKAEFMSFYEQLFADQWHRAKFPGIVRAEFLRTDSFELAKARLNRVGSRLSSSSSSSSSSSLSSQQHLPSMMAAQSAAAVGNENQEQQQQQQQLSGRHDSAAVDSKTQTRRRMDV